MKKTRILHIITKMAVGGAQENTIQTVEYLNKKGYYSEILCGYLEEHSGSLEEQAKEKDIEVKKINGITNSIRPLMNIIALFKTYKYIKRNRFDVVHTHSSVAGILGRVAARLAGTKIIIHTVHGWGIRPDLPGWKLSLYIFLERFCAGFTDKLIAVSETDIKKGLKHRIGSKDQYVLIRSGIDIKRFAKKIDIKKKKRELGLKPNLPVIGMIGRLDEQKNPMDFVEVASIVQKEAKAQFLIVGDGPLRKDVEAKAKDLGIDNIRIIGFRNDVEDILQTFDISVLTSLWEGLPRVIPESMAAKKPVIANKIDGCMESIENNRTGYLVTPKKPQETAKKLVFLLENPEKAKNMGATGYKKVSEYSSERMLKKIELLYKKLKNKD